MRTLLQFIVLIVGGLLVLSGCSSTANEPLAQVEQLPASTVAPTQMTQSDDVIENEAIEAETMSNGFIFYNSHATW